MNQKLFPLFLMFCLFVTFFSCSSTSDKRPRKPVSTISVQPSKQTYVCGDKITVEVNTKLRDGELKSVKLQVQDELIRDTKEETFKVENMELNQVGNIVLNVNAEKTDGLSNSRTKTVMVLSDVQPVQLSYQVINNYPHLVTSYTQGLEYHDGYLYEGTGENGHSKLLKVDIQTGNPVKVYDLAEKYFGEGITILNDKVYQLTYHSQKGFVYNLNTFAVIDSFRFASKEGWGLTNDGKNLIMSDGTHVLTWLDPNDFSIIKTLQVVNNRGLMTNLNELEYIDGMIYANIYTTDYIVKIDISNGKVLEEINMAGLINMYHKQNERIDYLNGIAFDHENNRIFVTGKLYPRIFEVKFISK